VDASGRQRTLDVVDPISTSVQRSLRRTGLAGYEPATMATLLAAFERQPPGFQFVDIGANMGLYSALCVAMFEPGRVIAFEPTPDVAAVARRVLAANERGAPVGRVEQCALGARAGTAPLYLSAVSDSSNSLVAGFKQSVGQIDVEVTTLDDYVETTATRPAIIKIDTETFEAAVIEGGRRTLERTRPWLVVEVLNRRGRDHGVDVSAAMQGLGYSYYRLSRAADWRPAASIAGVPGSKETDWLLAPDPIDARFVARVRIWLDRLSACTADRNPRLPLWALSCHVLRREGVRGFGRRAATYVRARRATIAVQR
jgi:FkbM family methyltransferase